jgi:hypothetical protein
MKNKILKKITTAFLILCVSFVPFVFGELVHSSVNQTELMSKPSNPELFNTIMDEVNKLKSNRSCYSDDENHVSIFKAESTEIAPMLYQLLNGRTQELAKKAGVEIEDILLYVGDGKEAYNLEAKMGTEYTVNTSSRKIVSETQKNRLAIGLESLKLFIWNESNLDCLTAVISHEIGHMYCRHKDESKKNEMEADLVGTCLSGTPELLSKGISMLSLAGCLFENLSSKTKFKEEQLREMVLVQTNSAIIQNATLGALGKSDSHTKFGTVVSKAVDKSLEEDGADKDLVMKKLNQNLITACSNSAKLFDGVSDDSLTMQCKKFEDNSGERLTHPEPVERASLLAKCEKIFSSSQHVR